MRFPTIWLTCGLSERSSYYRTRTLSQGDDSLQSAEETGLTFLSIASLDQLTCAEETNMSFLSRDRCRQ